MDERRHELAGPEVIETRKTGVWLLQNPSTNQATAFDRAARDELHVRGMVPHRVTTLAEQATAAIAQIRAKSTPLEQYIGMASLHDRNEVLFYRLLVDHIAELMPIVYTPTVGEACQKFSQIYRSARGLWITPDDVHDIKAVLRNSPYHDIRLGIEGIAKSKPADHAISQLLLKSQTYLKKFRKRRTDLVSLYGFTYAVLQASWLSLGKTAIPNYTEAVSSLNELTHVPSYELARDRFLYETWPEEPNYFNLGERLLKRDPADLTVEYQFTVNYSIERPEYRKRRQELAQDLVKRYPTKASVYAV